jgi:hypothetical protein
MLSRGNPTRHAQGAKTRRARHRRTLTSDLANRRFSALGLRMRLGSQDYRRVPPHNAPSAARIQGWREVPPHKSTNVRRLPATSPVSRPRCPDHSAGSQE